MANNQNGTSKLCIPRSHNYVAFLDNLFRPYLKSRTAYILCRETKKKKKNGG